MIYSKIDQVICNKNWFLKFPKCVVEFLKAHISNHTPIEIQKETGGRQQVHRKFKFLNCIIEQPQFGEIIQNNWANGMIGQPQYILWNKLMRLRPELRKLTHQVTDGVKNIQVARQKLEQAENKLATDLSNHTYLAEVQHWTKEVLHMADMEEKILRQQ